MANTSIPTGLTIARNGMKFTFSWKVTAKNHDSGQEIKWRVNDKGSWQQLPLATNVTSKTVTLSANDYYPNSGKGKLETVSFRVRGKRAPYEEGTGNNRHTITPDWSDWAEKTYTVKPPSKPSGEAVLKNANTTTFSCTAKNDAKNNQPFHSVEWWSVLTQGNVTDGSGIYFSGRPTTEHGTGSASDSHDTQESGTVATGSHTRWFKVKARGPAGDSGWKYLKHVYATPKKPEITEVKNKKEGGNVTLNMKWKASNDAGHPIDKVVIEYYIDTPSTGRAVPAGAQWIEARTQSDGPTNKVEDGARITISDAPGIDECMWVRVVCWHDENNTPSDNWYVRSGALATPTDVSVEASSSFLVTVNATNESDVPDSRMAVVMRTSKDPDKDIVVGVIAHDYSTGQFQCPAWDEDTTVAFGVYAFQGSAKSSTIDGVTTYAITPNMKSAIVWKGGTVPTAPNNLTATLSETPGEAILEWDWTWKESNATELSWSQNPNAWESTDEPETYLITNLRQPRWRISNLAVGVRWYFRARFAVTSAEDYNYGPYSEIVELDLTSAPAIPVLTLSKAVIAKGETFTAAWAYTTTDGTAQSYAEIAEKTVANNTETYTVIAHETTAQHVDITPNWNTGTAHDLCVRVTSASGHVSDGWSEPVTILVADPVACTITNTSISEITVYDSDSTARTVYALQAMPFTVTVQGACDTGQTTIIIERADAYHMMRPDETMVDGYDGETIAIIRQEGDDTISVSQNDLVGLLDDGAPYRMIAIVEDEYGQSASAELDFEVHWTHQAAAPTASVVIADGVAKITATAPSGVQTGDVIDIYRLSADKPELIIEGGAYGTTYVDPYPTLGENGGHRIVARTKNGDYITSDNKPAWIDVPTNVDEYSIIIDFDGRKVLLPYDIGLSNKWTKDFRVTNYLGGSQQGDWNAVVGRTGTFTTNLISDFDADTIEDMRALARHNGICHVRTPDGSSFAADIQVSENKTYSNWDIVGFTLTVTRIDPETLDGVTLGEWTG